MPPTMRCPFRLSRPAAFGAFEEGGVEAASGRWKVTFMRERSAAAIRVT